MLTEKAAERESRHCRACAGEVHPGGTLWVACPCDAFWVCSLCAMLMGNGLALAEHIKACKGRVDSVLDGESGRWAAGETRRTASTAGPDLVIGTAHVVFSRPCLLRYAVPDGCYSTGKFEVRRSSLC